MKIKKKNTILEEIIDFKKLEVNERKKKISIDRLKEKNYYQRKTISIKKRFECNNQIGIIAEIKKKSPSKGVINQNVNVLDTAMGYQHSNVAGISILTDNKFFGGDLNYLTQVRTKITIPILQKDFIIDPYQLYEAKAYGADVILLIASVLDIDNCQKLAVLAKKLGLEVLLEVHNLDELKNYMFDEITLLGVNNRNLKTFKTGIQNAINLLPHLPNKYIKIAESGIKCPETLLELKKIGYQGFLIGENFMKENSPQNACKTFSDICYNQMIKTS